MQMFSTFTEKPASNFIQVASQVYLKLFLPQLQNSFL